MDASAVADRYFEAWNRRDPPAIAAVFADGGTYTDPNVPDGIGPQETAAYAEGLFAGFPDLAFELESSGVRPDGSVAAQWVMTGTNSGSFQGLPPSGREVRLPGADVITVAGDRVASVVGYFDTAVVPRQLGLQVLVQPERAGSFASGTGAYVSKDGGEPGAMSLTVLEARSAEEIEEVRTRSRSVVTDLLGAPGFMSWLGVVADNRMFTITAWASADDVARLSESPAHAEAMRAFFAPAPDGLAAGGQTGVWGPHRLNGLWARCAACGRMVRPEPDGTCACGAELSLPRYW
jgi:steroid delta-isomerase-like uncharacterized protein